MADQNSAKTAAAVKKFTVLVIGTLVVFALLEIGLTGYWLDKRLSAALQDKSRAITSNVASGLANPLAMGEYDDLQKYLKTALDSDKDMAYALLLTPDGRVLATTDPRAKDRVLDQNEFDKSALVVTDITERSSPTPGIFEYVVPVKAASASAGILRIAFSDQAIQQKIRDSLMFISLLSLIPVGLGCLVLVLQGRTLAVASSVE